MQAITGIKISIPTGTIKRIFPFNQMKPNIFQFLLVRLKVVPLFACKQNFRISIPTGTIKRKNFTVDIALQHVFQFLLVRLKVKAKNDGSQSLLLDFNSYWYD
jgi:hypothetical protein